MNKANLTKWKEHTIDITFIPFSRPRIEKNDNTAIKVIGIALQKSNLPYIIFAKSTYALISCPNLFYFSKIDNVFTSLIESGTSSHIFGANDERLSLPQWTVNYLFLLRIDTFLRLQFLLANLNNEFTISGEILFLAL